MLRRHFYYELNNLNEFSSWSPSLLPILHYLDKELKGDRNARICVLDTHQAPNQIFQSQDLVQTAGLWRDNDIYPHEFMVHDKVSGDRFTTVPFWQILTDIYNLYPEISLESTVNGMVDVFGIQ